MQNTKEYWDEKSMRAKTAQNHTEEMQRKYAEQIRSSIEKTVVYSETPSYEGNSIPGVVLEDLDSVAAVMKYWKEGKTAVLNFASFKEPGGKFIEGSKAQEECLCHESYLYNVLRSFDDTYYAENRTMKNKALYKNRALYSPKILFERKAEHAWCDVITCAAPNKTAAQKYCHVSDAENRRALEERIDLVIAIANEHKVDTLILGAFGCGVFGQDPKEVAEVFRAALNRPMYLNRVVFAIPADINKNLEGFQTIFGGKPLGIENMTKRYFEIFLAKSDSRMYKKEYLGDYSLCIAGYRKPSVEEAMTFCRDDMEKFQCKSVVNVKELDNPKKDFDMSREETFPIFGVPTRTFEIGMDVTVSLSTLYDDGMQIFGKQIQMYEEDGKRYFDLIGGNGEILCLDGETCTVISVNPYEIVLRNDDGVRVETFWLPLQAAVICCFVNP